MAELERPASHRVVSLGLTALENLAHRGAFGADPSTGDGAGALIQIPHKLFSKVAGFDLPAPGSYGTGMAFLPRDDDQAHQAMELFGEIALSEGLEVLGWREVPVELSVAGEGARASAPRFSQVFLADGPPRPGRTRRCGDALERQCFVVRKRVEHAEVGVYFASLSTRTIVYKGMLAPQQLRGFYPDLSDERLESRIALVHSRFSTNTFPSWPLAHPYRLIAHNGEINTLAGNRNWMRAREAFLQTDRFEGEIGRIFPIVTPGASDSASFDEVLELLHLAGRPLAHAVLMMIPEAWQNHTEMDEARRAFYGFHASLMEPWDGPAAVAFTDGTVVGAVLDRNGLRPARYWVTDDGLVVLASEVGVLDLDPATVVKKGRLQPGRMFLVDTGAGRIVEDEEIKSALAAEHPYGDWLSKGLVHLHDLPPRLMLTPQHASVVRHQRLFGVTSEELSLIIEPMARTGAEPIGSMGSDTPIAVLSERPRLLYDYFTQLFAQVTNPPLDAIREELVTSLEATVGPERNLLEPEPASCRQISLPYPVIGNDDLAKLLYVNEHGETPGFQSFAVDGLFPVAEGGAGLEAALDKVCQQVSEAIALGANIIVLSDRNASATSAPIPSLLLTAAVHNHLVREKERTRVGLIVESGDAREVHHFALLIGYGAAAVNPYLALESIAEMVRDGLLGELSEREAFRRYLKAASKGVLKVMSKMGISTVASYTGAQVFEAIGLDRDLMERYFGATPSRLGGICLTELAEEVARRHRYAYEGPEPGPGELEIEPGGEYQWRRGGEYHLFNPRTV
ncbi:MAG: glutamate synthase central domain-containing protein, partial [Acidimicrobiales bacterium]